MPPSPILPTTTTTSSTYTTIPISVGEVISRSTQNLSSCISRRRPWPEFFTSFDFPADLSDASSRFRTNLAYFSVNYCIITVVCTAIALIGTPIPLLVLAFLFYLWLIFHFFREDPLLVMGRHVSDMAVIVTLLVVSIAALWIIGPLAGLSTGIGIGLVLAVLHGVVRNPEGLFLDETGAVTNGLLVGRSARPPL